MKIAHICRYNPPYLNDDEGSISDGLRKLGNMVVDVLESEVDGLSAKHNIDLCLFHHWYSSSHTIDKLPSRKKAIWFFDLVDFSKSCPNDRMLQRRGKQRRGWLKTVLPHVDHVFCTDGDWDAEDKTSKVHLLRQGADQRIIQCQQFEKDIPILFVGASRSGGKRRQQFVEMLANKFNGRFTHVLRGKYREDLRGLVARAKIVVAPDCPVTDRYWSNRVYVMLGFGTFLLHPFCEQLTKEYEDGRHLVYYQNQKHLMELIDYYLQPDLDETRTRIALWGLERTLSEHTYLHRCIKFMQIINAKGEGDYER